jgi:hypothetical protein
MIQAAFRSRRLTRRAETGHIADLPDTRAHFRFRSLLKKAEFLRFLGCKSLISRVAGALKWGFSTNS